MFRNRKIPKILGPYGPMVVFFLLTLGCSGGALAPGGGGALGENPAPVSQVAFNPGSVQSGGEGHGQEQKKTPNAASVSLPDGKSNCGVDLSEAQEIFSSEGPVLHLSFGGESGPFAGITTVNANRFGRSPIPECPTAVPIVENGQKRFQIPGFVRVVATFTDDSGKKFQSLPKVITCQAVCATPPCEVCIDLKDASEIPDSEGVDPPAGEPSDGFKRPIDLDDLTPVQDPAPSLPILLKPNIDLSNPLKIRPGTLNP